MNTEISNSLLRSISDSPEIPENILSKDVGEIITEESIKYIPFVNGVQKFYNSVIAVRDSFLIKKVLCFLYNLSDVSKEKK